MRAITALFISFVHAELAIKADLRSQTSNTYSKHINHYIAVINFVYLGRLLALVTFSPLVFPCTIKL